MRGSVPAILVGTWGGGSSGETAGSSYTFTSDGRFQIRRYGGQHHRRRGSPRQHHHLLLQREIRDEQLLGERAARALDGYRFSLNLQIDGYSYVRDV